MTTLPDVCTGKSHNQSVQGAGEWRGGSLGIGRHQLYAHRIVFAMHRGRWPSAVDHVNGDRLDNRIENLREADCTQNNANRSAQVNNMAGFKGVVWYDRGAEGNRNLYHLRRMR
jgi:hypothetical protein